jgi:hypothetical protein
MLCGVNRLVSVKKALYNIVVPGPVKIALKHFMACKYRIAN